MDREWVQLMIAFLVTLDLATPLTILTIPALEVPILIRHPVNKELLVNYDPMINQAIKEIDCIRKLDLEVPHAGLLLCHMENRLKRCVDELTVRIIPSLSEVDPGGVFFAQNFLVKFLISRSIRLRPPVITPSFFKNLDPPLNV